MLHDQGAFKSDLGAWGRVFPFRPDVTDVQTILDAQLTDSGVVSITRLDADTPGTIVAARLRQMRGSIQTERVVNVPPWGISFPVDAGSIRVDAQVASTTPQRLSGAVAPGRAVADWVRVEPGKLVIAATGTVVLVPVLFARRLMLTGIAGVLDLTKGEIALASGNTIWLPADTYTIGSAPGATAVAAWEVFS